MVKEKQIIKKLHNIQYRNQENKEANSKADEIKILPLNVPPGQQLEIPRDTCYHHKENTILIVSSNTAS